MSGPPDPWYDEQSRRRRARRRRAGAVLAGLALIAFGVAAATNWIVGLNGGSSGESQSVSVSNLTIAAVASPAASNLLFPGGNGDVVATITNPNAVPVTLTAVNLPTNTTFAAGYTASNLTGAVGGCTSTVGANQSDVIWNFATGSSGSSHTLTTPLVVGANATLTVTFTNDASMTAAAPAACQGVYFSMPALTGVSATAGAGTATTSPATDGWTS